jgi:DNA polymerase-3 subunit gamma/tau
MKNSAPLTRRWRSKNFDEIIGQDIAVRLIKNSLYRGFFFPVYLFSGQRGCGKTTMGRVFSAAINCTDLPVFQSDPKKVLPCGSCPSCMLLARGEHPDFIEIDAASHTGVDNVRQIIESASFLPVVGRKKIYLIDEAHMLSRAAFNACLKMLEEPPAQALFILATTEPEKVPETVRSRCMQLFFGPVARETIVAHLAHIAQAEAIPYQAEALAVIADSTDGSVRDAVTCFEQAALAFGTVTVEAVETFVGRFVGAAAEALFAAVCSRDCVAVRGCIRSVSALPDLIRLGEALSCMVRDALWVSLGVPGDGPSHSVSQSFLYSFCEALARAEIARINGRSYPDALEAALIGIFIAPEALVSERPPVRQQAPVPVRSASNQAQQSISAPKHAEPVAAATSEKPLNTEQASPWALFVALIEESKEPLLVSIFKQGSSVSFHEGSVGVSFPRELSFFTDVLSSTKLIWSPLLHKAYGAPVELLTRFDAASSGMPSSARQPISDQAKPTSGHQKVNPSVISHELVVREAVVKNLDEWPLAAKLLEAFPGTITKIS